MINKLRIWNRINDSRKISLEQENRKILLNKLGLIVESNNELTYLINPILNLKRLI
ncbi:TPA: hypothetical protein ACKOOW_001069 [Clostridioides difficile]|nr:hypothetical protein [Clostridioides difficile]MDM0193203.1 hypothetical protein [Clostridioides difficile]HBF0046018.1 hypothetical protein [Clostridioides difficile]HBF0054048.1 hypothetical protein [Clostridioides difficile]HBF7021612.1 hypothetical protein [Clostridioides difficile]